MQSQKYKWLVALLNLVACSRLHQACSSIESTSVILLKTTFKSRVLSFCRLKRNPWTSRHLLLLNTECGRLKQYWKYMPCSLLSHKRTFARIQKDSMKNVVLFNTSVWLSLAQKTHVRFPTRRRVFYCLSSKAVSAHTWLLSWMTKQQALTVHMRCKGNIIGPQLTLDCTTQLGFRLICHWHASNRA